VKKAEKKSNFTLEESYSAEKAIEVLWLEKVVIGFERVRCGEIMFEVGFLKVFFRKPSSLIKG